MLPDPGREAHATSRGPLAESKWLSLSRPVVKLVPFDPGLPPRLIPADPDSQCDCACFALEGEEMPVLSAPVSFYLELTPLCDSRCPACGNVFGQPPHTPSLPLAAEQWQQILAKIQPYAYRLKLTGGEPTLHPEFEIIVAQVASLNIPFTLFTNGRWSAPQQITGLLAGVPGLEGLLVSVHGPGPASHEAFSQAPGSFAQVTTNIQAALMAGLPVSLSCTVTHHNWHLVGEMLELARQLGASGVVFNRYVGPAIAGLTSTTQELKAATQSVVALRASGHPVKLGNCLPACFVSTGQAGCLAGRAFATVDPWGRVRPCNHAPLLCGSLLQQSVAEIWASSGLAQWRNWHPEPCSTCAGLSTCRGGCQAHALSLGLEADPLIGVPFSSIDDRPIAELTLYELARPTGHFVRRPEEFGSLLICGNRLFPVSRQMQGPLDMLAGDTTLRQIQAAHGTSGLALVAALYRHRMVELQV